MTIKTLYQVTVKGRVVATGSHQQCWIWVRNSFRERALITDLIKHGVCVMPVNNSLEQE